LKLRLILGDQLNHNHSWFKTVDKNIIYFMAEMRQETDYVVHHVQKIVAFFTAMRSFSEKLKEKGHTVIYYPLDHPKNTQSLTKNCSQLIEDYAIETFEYQLPDEYRLDKQLKDFCNDLKIKNNVYDSEHFLTSRTDLRDFFKGKKQFTMEYFYRYMRKRYNIMMLDDKNPEGGKWNFDQNNRNKWKGEHLIPTKKDFSKNVLDIIILIEKQHIKTIGTINAKHFDWATTRSECLNSLDYFCNHLLIHFGTYQDAMYTNEWYLFHSNLSFALNCKLLHPVLIFLR